MIGDNEGKAPTMKPGAYQMITTMIELDQEEGLPPIPTTILF